MRTPTAVPAMDGVAPAFALSGSFWREHGWFAACRSRPLLAAISPASMPTMATSSTSGVFELSPDPTPPCLVTPSPHGRGFAEAIETILAVRGAAP